MNLPQLSIHRKVAITCFILLLILFGINSYRKISFDIMPRMDIPTVIVNTVYPGASPEEVQVDIAKKQEDAISVVEGIRSINTLCAENLCTISVAFEVGNNVDLKIHEVREQLNTIAEDMPQTAEQPQLSKVSMNAIPVVTMYLTGQQSIDELYDYVKDKLKPRFSTIQGVGEVSIHGGNEMELHIKLDKKKLNIAGLALPELIERIQNANVKIPAGQIKKKSSTEFSISYDAEFKDIKDLRQLDVGNSDNHVFLGDIAEIKLESQKLRQIGLYNETPAIQFQIVKKSDANTLKVIETAKEIYNNIIKAGLPSGMELHWFMDESEIINGSIEDSWETVIMGILLTAFMLFLFMHNPRSTFILGVTMPVTICISIGGIYLMGYNFDTISLIALASSTGVLVTNSIVVVENILKRINSGVDSEKASIDGANDVFLAVVASAMTNIVVFIPCLFMTTLVGMYIAPFAGTMIVVTIVSLFISFSLTPILTNSLCKNGIIKNPLLKWFSNKWNNGFDAFSKICQKSFTFTRNYPGTVVFIILALCIAIAAVTIPEMSIDFLPWNDQNKVTVQLKMPSNSSLEATRKTCLDIVKIINQNKEVVNSGTTVGYLNNGGGDISEGVHMAEITVRLVHKSERPDMDHEKFAAKLRKQLAVLNNVNLVVSIPGPTGASGQDMCCYLTGPDLEKLKSEALRLTKVLRDSGKVTEANSNVIAEKPRFNILPDRTILKNFNISESNLGTYIVGLVDGIKVGNFKYNGRTYDIRVMADSVESLDEINKVVVGDVDGEPVNLGNVTNTKTDPTSIVISRDDRELSVYVYINFGVEYAQSDIMETIEEDFLPDLPAGYNFHRDNLDTMLNNSMNEFTEVFITAVILLYLLMAAIMESWGKPLLIMFTLPLGLVGMFAGVVVLNIPLTMVTLMGGIMMLGIVVNDAILIVDETYNLIKTKEMKPHDAMNQAIITQLRPIIMTTVASVAGMLPMVLGNGMGSELRQSCGAGVLGGQCLPAFLTVYLIPALYYKFVKNK